MLVGALVVAVVYYQFRGEFTLSTQLTMLSHRSGLQAEPGTKVTYNGVPVGRVADVTEVDRSGTPAAKLLLDVDSRYTSLIPANVDVDIVASTVFGNKYVSFTSPKSPSPQRITPQDVIDATAVTTEFNTLFETVLSVTDSVDPVKLNQTLTNVADALDGLGEGFGQSLLDANAILGSLNARQSQLRNDFQLLADVAEVYTAAAPDLFDGLDNASSTANTLYAHRGDLTDALMASIGFSNASSEVFERAGPYFTRVADDLIATTQLLDEYQGMIYCTLRNYHDVEPKFAAGLGGNGYSGTGISPIMGAGNPYVYPDNLPRVNASGGPEGKPGCWQPITRDLWPAPYLVMDTGASIAPYNHFELAQPILIEYVWGRQIGENTINP